MFLSRLSKSCLRKLPRISYKGFYINMPMSSKKDDIDIRKPTNVNDLPSVRKQNENMSKIEQIMKNNREWSQNIFDKEPQFFKQLSNLQTPNYLWIGCADSRVPANQIMGLKPGEVFVHRNVANLVPLSDINALAVIQYAVEVLEVKDIIVTGHYGCGGIRASFKMQDHGKLEAWLSYIRDLRSRFRQQLVHSQQENENLLCELNVKQQVYNVAKTTIVQRAWKAKKQLRIHGMVYKLDDGLLKDLGLTISSVDQLPKQFHIVK